MKFRVLLILASSVAAATQVNALSLGSSTGSVQLGQPVDLVFPVQPDSGKTVASSCLRALLHMGDTALIDSQVLVTAQANSVRVRSTLPVYEPLVTLQLSAGCADTMARSYTFFADPPSTLAASVQPINLSQIQIAPLAMAVPRVATPHPPHPRKPRAAKRLVNAQAAQQLAASTAAAPNTETEPSPALQAPAAEVAPRTNALAPATDGSGDKPRLRIEPLEGLEGLEGLDAATLTTPAAPSAAAQDAPLTPPPPALADANAARLEALEQQLQTLQQQLSSNRSQVAGLQSELVQAQNAGQPVWVHLLLGLLALALASIAWLLQRNKQERQNTQRTWAHAVGAAEDALAPRAALPQQTYNQAPASSAAPATSSVARSAMPDASLAQRPPAARSATPAASTVPAMAPVLTTQALFDVQEQAEFYASIGENDHAIEILQSHIAKHETSSPQAYLELLQLLYRLGRTAMFEQVRNQFHTHFNVQVPALQDFAHKGRDLWSGHPDTLHQIEAQWPSDAVQELLRSLIVRSPTAHAENAERFELSAFGDLLMLYNVTQKTPASSRGQLPRPLQTASAPMSAAQPPAAPTSPSPFSTTTPWTSDDALDEGLTLEWEAPPPIEAPTPPAARPALDATLETIQLEAKAPSAPQRPTASP